MQLLVQAMSANMDKGFSLSCHNQLITGVSNALTFIFCQRKKGAMLVRFILVSASGHHYCGSVLSLTLCTYFLLLQHFVDYQLNVSTLSVYQLKHLFYNRERNESYSITSNVPTTREGHKHKEMP